MTFDEWLLTVQRAIDKIDLAKQAWNAAQAAEREACAALCDQLAREHKENIGLIENGQLSGKPPVQRWHEAQCIAAAIRARGGDDAKSET